MTLQSLQNQRAHDQKIKQQNRKSRRQFDFSVSTLRLYSCMRQDDVSAATHISFRLSSTCSPLLQQAAKVLGVAPITLKRICNRRNYRWPYRTVKAAERRRERQRAAAIAAAITQQHPVSVSTLPHVPVAQLPLSPPTTATSPPERRPMSPLALKLASPPVATTTTRLPPLRVVLHAHFAKPSALERPQLRSAFSFADVARVAPSSFTAL